MKTTNQSFDHQSYENTRKRMTQSDINSNSLDQKYVSLEISKLVHTRLFRALSKDQKCNALYNLDKFLHQILDKWEQEEETLDFQIPVNEVSHWKSHFQKK